MSIDYRPLSQCDENYLNVIELYKEAFAGVQRIPSWLLRFMMRNGKPGFSVLYEGDKWLGLIYIVESSDIVFVQFFAISESLRSGGYGSKVVDSMKYAYVDKRIVLNIEDLDDTSENYQQRLKRKAFYTSNGFESTGYIVKEPGERLEMLILGGSINRKEISALYKRLFGKLVGSFLVPEVIKIE